MVYAIITFWSVLIFMILLIAASATRPGACMVKQPRQTGQEVQPCTCNSEVQETAVPEKVEPVLQEEPVRKEEPAQKEEPTFRVWKDPSPFIGAEVGDFA
jgi:hypothetical protein